MSKVASTALFMHTMLAGAVIGMRLPNPIVVRLTKAKEFNCAKFRLHRLPDEPPSDYPAVLKDRPMVQGRSLTKAVFVSINSASGLATSKAPLMVPPAATPFPQPFPFDQAWEPGPAAHANRSAKKQALDTLPGQINRQGNAHQPNQQVAVGE